MFYDLHLHSSLSPCADNDMTPANIAGFMALSGADIIAVTDHNSALNLPAVKKACDHYGIKLLPGIEANTSEEIHILCYLPSVEAALELGEMIYNTLPDIRAEKSIWGEQLIVDTDDKVTGTVDKLLTLASGFSVYDLKTITEKLGGMVVPAHVDRDSYSLVSVMGFLPDDLRFEALEFTDPRKYTEFKNNGIVPDGARTLTSSDAHTLEQLTRGQLAAIENDHPLMRLIDRL